MIFSETFARASQQSVARPASRRHNNCAPPPKKNILKKTKKKPCFWQVLVRFDIKFKELEIRSTRTSF